MMKTIPWPIIPCQYFLATGDFLAPGSQKKLDNENKFYKFERKFYPKIAKIRDVKTLKTILLPLEAMRPAITKPCRRLAGF